MNLVRFAALFIFVSGFGLVATPAHAVYERQNIKLGVGLGVSAEYERLIHEHSNTAWNFGVQAIPETELDNSNADGSEESDEAIDSANDITEEDLDKITFGYTRVNLGLRHYMKPYRSFYIGYGIFHTQMNFENALVNATAAYTGPYAEVGYNLQMYRAILGVSLQLGAGFGTVDFDRGELDDLFLELNEGGAQLMPSFMINLGFAI